MLVKQNTEVSPASKRSHTPPPPPSPQPAHTQSNWLPVESVIVSTAVAGYPMLPVIAGGQGRPGLAALIGTAAAPPLQNVSAHIYRCLRRAFTLWPLGQQRDSLAALRVLLLQVCLPWRSASSGALYSAAWQPHVLAHLPFYHVLIPVFLSLVHATVDFSADMALAEALAVAQVCVKRHSFQIRLRHQCFFLAKVLVR